MQDETGAPLIVLMHGDLEVSTKQLARAIGCKHVEPCKPEVANRHSGYLVGGTSPVRHPQGDAGLRRADDSGPAVIYINGGARGFLVGIAPAELVRAV